MTRILTIIALLFATPVLAYPECEVPEVSKPRECKNCLKPQIICNDTRENCTKRRAEIAARLKKADDELAVSLGYKEAQEMYRARNICPRKYLKPSDGEQLSDSTKAKIEASKLRMQRARERENELNAAKIRRRLSSSYGDLQDRVDELEAEVEQLRNR